MFTARGDGEITFYEELGLRPDATPQEIRDAFRLFVRLVHPDHQTDPQLREIAEKQTRKLNRIYSVLSDPESRRAYDELLETGPPPRSMIVNPSALPPEIHRLTGKLPWIAAMVVSAGVLIWLAYDDATPGTQNRNFDPNTVLATSTPPASPAYAPAKTGAHSVPQSEQIARLKSDLRAAIVERDAAVHELEKLRGTTDDRAAAAPGVGGTWPLESTAPASPLTTTELPSGTKIPSLANSVTPRVERPASRKLAGFWFYAKPPNGQKNKNASLYLPEYIEATIVDEGGTIHGRYRSRFVIADRAISPEVNFTFTGIASGPQCYCQWTGAGGAKGDLTLKLTGDNALRVDWIANEMGSLGLGSGTATLTRQIE